LFWTVQQSGGIIARIREITNGGPKDPLAGISDMPTATARRQMKLSMFLTGDGNYHLAGWRLSEDGERGHGGCDMRQWVEFGRTMERGKLDMLFIADGGISGVNDIETLGLTSRIDRLDPVTILSALAMTTRNLGLVSTISTTYHEPFNVARTVASLDHVSGGRAGWNIVTTASKDEAQNFSRTEHLPHGERYERAEEFVDVVRGLWDSYEDDAFPRHKASGIYMDAAKVNFLNHRGRYFSVRGPLSVPRPPQGHPILVQAGSSEPGINLSARVADVMFTSQSSLPEAKAFYDKAKSRCDRFGRSPDDIKIMPGVLLFIGRTQEEAMEKFERLQSLIPIRLALQRLSEGLGGIDLSGYALDAPMPDIAVNNVRVSSVESYASIARREGLTLRQTAMRAAAAKHHLTIIGSPAQIADELESWFVNGAADGFNVLCSDVPGGLNDFVDLVVPELQRRGLFRQDYEGTMLRDNLGLSRPLLNEARASA
jgi:FMN-dependent oxidoreductase (nitrilotriacetate monooxygenase family)